MNKPNKQTVIPVSAVPALMGDLALNKIRNFGGKLGQALEALGCVTAADVLKLSHAQLEAAVGDNAAYDSNPTVDCPRDAAVFGIFVYCRFILRVGICMRRCMHGQIRRGPSTEAVYVMAHGLKRRRPVVAVTGLRALQVCG